MSEQPLLAPEDGPALGRLSRALAAADGFTLILMVGSSLDYLERAAEAALVDRPDLVWVRLHRGYGSPLDQAARALGGPVVLSGLEELAADDDEKARMLTQLNLSRPDWKRRLPVPVVLLLTRPMLAALARWAPDFHRYRSLLLDLSGSLIPDGGVFMPWLSAPDRQDRIADLRQAVSQLKNAGARDILRRISEWEWELALHQVALGENGDFSGPARRLIELGLPLPTLGRRFVRKLNFTELPIDTLPHLEGFNHVTKFHLDNSPFKNIEPISDLIRLRILFMNYCPTSNLTPLASLKELSWLIARGCHIEYLDPLIGLSELTSLDLGYCPIQSITPIAGLLKLTHLSLDGTMTESVEPLSGLSRLLVLQLNECPIESVAPLAKLPNLRKLDIRGCPVKDLDSLDLTSIEIYQ